MKPQYKPRVDLVVCATCGVEISRMKACCDAGDHYCSKCCTTCKMRSGALNTSGPSRPLESPQIVSPVDRIPQKIGVDPKLYHELSEKFEVYMAEHGFTDRALVGDLVWCGFNFACEQVTEYAEIKKCAYCGSPFPRDKMSPTNGYCARCRERSHHDLEAKLKNAREACELALKALLTNSDLDKAVGKLQEVVGTNS